ncbi:transmembrane protein 14A-like isoform 2-T2 [Anomaloglossus baeobatrachus]|uniref:transmembrane protein 14A-like isoform X2 n=1 Tax=Anomaloglossus baeobatrachus TaxID=238106 RepID=UPI003F4F5A9F
MKTGEKKLIMAIDWFGFGYASMLIAGGFMGFSRKGSIVSLFAGLAFGLISGYGAICVSYNQRDIKISLIAAAALTIIMGVRYNHSRKLMPAGLVTIISIVMIFKLLINLT